MLSLKALLTLFGPQSVLRTLLDPRTPLFSISRPNFTRITTLRFSEDVQSPVSPIFEELCRQILARQDRPQLVALHAHCISSIALSGIECWGRTCGNTIRKLCLTIGGSDDHCFLPATAALPATLQALTGRLPTLQILELDAELESLRLGQRIDLALEVRSLCAGAWALQTLRLKLDLVDATPDMCRGLFDALAALPALEEVDLFSTTSAVQDPTRGSQPVAPPQVRFRCLHKMHISAPPSRCVQVFGNMVASVSQLRLDFRQLEEERELQRALATIASATPASANDVRAPRRLSDVSIAALFMPQAIPRPVTMSSLTDVNICIVNTFGRHLVWATLAPLFAAQDMRAFSIRHPHALSYTSTDLLDLFQAWPRIHRLSLNPRPSKGSVSYSLPLLDILADVAQSAPCLEVFETMLQWTPHYLVPSDTWAPHVDTLDLGHSVGPEVKGKVMATRRYIDKLFPDVKLVAEDCSHWVERVSRATTRTQES